MALGRAEASSPRARRRKRRIGRRAGRAQRRAEAAGREDRRFPPASVGWGEGGKEGEHTRKPVRTEGGTWGARLPAAAQSVPGSACGKPPRPAWSERASERASPPLALLRLPQPAVAATSAAFGPVGSRSPPGQPALFRQRPRQTCCEAAAAAAAAGARRMVGPRRRQPLLVAAAAGAAPAL